MLRKLSITFFILACLVTVVFWSLQNSIQSNIFPFLAAASLVVVWALVAVFGVLTLYWFTIVNFQVGAYVKPRARLSFFVACLWIWPYLVFYFFVYRTYRAFSKKPVFTEVSDGLWIGARPLRSDHAFLKEKGVKSVLDLTSEIRLSSFGRQAGAKNLFEIPLLDDTAPDVRQLTLGVEWCVSQLKTGPVLVHCTYGHARSAVFVVALLIALGKAEDLAEATRILFAERKGAYLTVHQNRALVKWYRLTKGSSSKLLSV